MVLFVAFWLNLPQVTEWLWCGYVLISQVRESDGYVGTWVCGSGSGLDQNNQVCLVVASDVPLTRRHLCELFVLLGA